jgi:hypothetical protein
MRASRDESDRLRIFDIMDGERLFTGPPVDKKALYGEIKLPEEDEAEEVVKKPPQVGAKDEQNSQKQKNAK